MTALACMRKVAPPAVSAITSTWSGTFTSTVRPVAGSRRCGTKVRAEASTDRAWPIHRATHSYHIPRVSALSPLFAASCRQCERGRLVDELPRGGAHVDGQEPAEPPLLQETLHRGVELEGERRRHHLRDEARVRARSGEHPARLGRVHRHPRLAQHVLPRLEGGDGRLPMKNRPRADQHRVDAGIGDHVLPPVVYARDAEPHRDRRARLPGSVGHRDDLHPGYLPKLRNVDVTRVRARADDADPDPVSLHRRPPRPPCPARKAARW